MTLSMPNMEYKSADRKKVYFGLMIVYEIIFRDTQSL